MGTKALIVGILWAVAIVLFALVGLTIEDGAPDFNFIGAGLALSMIGFALDKFWAAAWVVTEFATYPKTHRPM